MYLEKPFYATYFAKALSVKARLRMALPEEGLANLNPIKRKSPPTLCMIGHRKGQLLWAAPTVARRRFSESESYKKKKPSYALYDWAQKGTTIVGCAHRSPKKV
jgi:hypothetical protein